MLQRILILTVLLVAAQTVSAGKPASTKISIAETRVITRCEAPVEFSDRHQYVALGANQERLVPMPLLLTLIQQSDNSYDVLAGSDSVSGKRVGLVRMPSGEGPVHLVLNNGSGMEHFLFVLNQDGSGELLWSSATASALTTCTVTI